jgi:hypothetical protein
MKLTFSYPSLRGFASYQAAIMAKMRILTGLLGLLQNMGAALPFLYPMALCLPTREEAMFCGEYCGAPPSLDEG